MTLDVVNDVRRRMLRYVRCRMLGYMWLGQVRLVEDKPKLTDSGLQYAKQDSLIPPFRKNLPLKGLSFKCQRCIDLLTY